MAKKSFLNASDAAIISGAGEGTTKVFGGITDASDAKTDPIADLLDRTNKYTVTPTPIATPAIPIPSVEKKPAVVEDDSIGAGEETGFSPEFIRQQNEQLQGKKVGTDVAFVDMPDPSKAASKSEAEYAETISDDGPQPIDADRVNRRRRVISKFSGKFINDFLTTASVMAHEAFVSPKTAIKEHSELMARLGSLSPTESTRLQQLDQQVKQYTEMKSDYADRAKMDQDDLAELQECISDVLDAEDVQIHPGWLILIIVGFQVIGNAVGIFFDRVSMRKK